MRNKKDSSKKSCKLGKSSKGNTSSQAQPATPPPDDRVGGDFLMAAFMGYYGDEPLSPATSPSSSTLSTRSPTSDHDIPGEICKTCCRRENKVIFIECRHQACISCTKSIWTSMTNRENETYDPWPTSFPYPSCEGVVQMVKQTDSHSASNLNVDGEGMPIADWILPISGRTTEKLERENREKFIDTQFTDDFI